MDIRRTMFRGLVPCAWLCVAGSAAAEMVASDEPIPGVVREMGYFLGAEEHRLAYTVYRPAASKRYPTVAWFDVYGAGGIPPLPLVRAWVDAGYAFVGGSVRGTGCSRGTFEPFNREHDARDGAAFVEFIATQKWSTGKVGLLGNSQPGILQFGIAALAPQHLVAIAPGGTLARLYDDVWYPGGIFNAFLAGQWGRVDQPGASRKQAAARVAAGDDLCSTLAANIGPNTQFARVQSTPFDDDWYRWPSPWERAPDIRVPTLMVQSWTDPVVGNSALWNFERLGAQYKRLFVTNGGHEAYGYSTAQAEVHRWMDRWVKGEKNGVEREPRVHIDFEAKIESGEAYGQLVQATPAFQATLPDWPAPDTRWTTLVLRGDGRLATDAPAPTDGEENRTYQYPAGTEFPTDNAHFALSAADAGSLRWRSAPMNQDTAILGAPQLQLYAASDQSDTDFMAMLFDVSPAGDVTYLERGFLRASHRAVDATRSLPQRVFHPHDRSEPLVPGEITELRWSLWPIAHVLRAGHSLELLIAAPNPVPSPGWGVIPLPLAGFNTIVTLAAQPSTLRLPVVPGVKAGAPAPACGSLLFQPCRKAVRPG